MCSRNLFVLDFSCKDKCMKDSESKFYIKGDFIMRQKTQNRSILRTQTLLKDGLTELMRKKTIQKISVKELTDFVNLNRGTFYLHYKDIYDLMEQLENDLLDEFIEINQTYDANELNGKPFPLLLELFTFLDKNAEFVSILLIENRDQTFVDKLKNLLKERCLNDWITIFAHATPDMCDLYSSYVLSGCIGIIKNWFENGRKQTPEDLARYTENILLHGLNILK